MCVCVCVCEFSHAGKKTCCSPEKKYFGFKTKQNKKAVVHLLIKLPTLEIHDQRRAKLPNKCNKLVILLTERVSHCSQQHTLCSVIEETTVLMKLAC